MEYTEEVLQYLKKNGKSRAYQIIKGVRMPRREVFRSLRLLRRRGLAHKEGYHPKILHSLLPGVAEALDEKEKVAAKTKVNKPKLSAGSVAGSGDWKKIYSLQRELERAEIEIKRLAALLKSQEDETELVRKISKRYFQENEKLSKEIFDLRYKRKTK